MMAWARGVFLRLPSAQRRSKIGLEMKPLTLADTLSQGKHGGGGGGAHGSAIRSSSAAARTTPPQRSA